ncbi:hypothetical protein Bca4012_031630 [Brassica carinata]
MKARRKVIPTLMVAYLRGADCGTTLLRVAKNQWQSSTNVSTSLFGMETTARLKQHVQEIYSKEEEQFLEEVPNKEVSQKGEQNQMEEGEQNQMEEEEHDEMEEEEHDQMEEADEQLTQADTRPVRPQKGPPLGSLLNPHRNAFCFVSIGASVEILRRKQVGLFLACFHSLRSDLSDLHSLHSDLSGLRKNVTMCYLPLLDPLSDGVMVSQIVWLGVKDVFTQIAKDVEASLICVAIVSRFSESLDRFARPGRTVMERYIETGKIA